MRLYLDITDCSEWHAIMPTGMFYGITINLLLTVHAGFQYQDMVWDYRVQIAADLGAKEFHAQTCVDGEQSLARRTDLLDGSICQY